MHRFIHKSVVFLIGSYVLALLLQIMIFFFVTRIQTGDFGVLNAINAGRVNTDILVCGSSRGQSHYNPIVISKVTGLSCYNISQNGSRLGVQLPVAKWYFEKNQPPKYLLLNIDLFTVDLEPYVYLPYKYLPYLNNNSLYAGLSHIDRNLWIHKWIPLTNLILYNKDFQKAIFRNSLLTRHSKKDSLINGYYTNDYQWLGDEWEADHVKKHWRARISISQTHKEYLKELIGLCKSHGTQLIFVVSPEYYRSMEFLLNRKEIVNYYINLCQEYQITWLDFSSSEICRNKRLWFNYIHMNSAGADQFSQQLATQLKNLVIDRVDGQ